MSDIRDREDDIERFVHNTEGKVYSRRVFFGMCAALGIAPVAARLSPAMADQKELVLVNWGGDAVRGMKASFVDPYLKKFPDRKVAIDGTGPSTSRIRLMVQSGKVTWDIMDRNLHTALEIGPENMLEKIDYSIVDKSKVRPEHAVEWGIGNYLYAMVLTYNTKRWGGALPTSWKDVWDFKKFPGKRAFRREPDAVLEAALMADGVPLRQDLPDRHEARPRHAQEDEGARDLLHGHRGRPECLSQWRGPSRPAAQYTCLAAEAGYQRSLRLDLERRRVVGAPAGWCPRAPRAERPSGNSSP